MTLIYPLGRLKAVGLQKQAGSVGKLGGYFVKGHELASSSTAHQSTDHQFQQVNIQAVPIHKVAHALPAASAGPSAFNIATHVMKAVGTKAQRSEERREGKGGGERGGECLGR